MGARGAFTFVLHSHLPYARLAGRWPHGEEWIHEAAVESYLPLLETLYALREDGVRFRLSIGITPVLGEQLADDLVKDHLDQYLDQRIDAAQRDLALYTAPETQDATLAALADYYLKEYSRIKQTFNVQFNRDILGAFRKLQDEGYIEIFASAATHGYLPLLARDSSVNAQIKAGIETHKRLFGRAPRIFWLPECAYRPGYTTRDGHERPGIEAYLRENGISLFFSDTHAITADCRSVSRRRRDRAVWRYSAALRHPALADHAFAQCNHVSALRGTERGRSAVGRARDRAQPARRPAGVEQRLGLPRRLRLPRVSPPQQHQRPAILARDGREDRPRPERPVPP
ncbi:MAG: hypothetical protein HC828_15975 [Blastochloris sp.]|nr:hypothetical protein [Blastochloris sp.]